MTHTRTRRSRCRGADPTRIPASSRRLVCGGLVALGVLATACTHAGHLATQAPLGPAPPIAAEPPATGTLVINDGPGVTPAGLEGLSYATERCAYRYEGSWVLPDPRCTPGAIDGRVTQGNLAETICRPGGYTSSVRPPESITEPAKHEAMAAYGATGPARDYEFDHLVPLGLGGSSDTRNLWPEPNQGSPGQFDPSDPYGNNAKDGVEDALHQAVCEGRVPLRAAQVAIATDWPDALRRLGLG
jgi:hypothetical protein